MLRLYLKIWDRDLIFSHAVKGISSPGILSPWAGVFFGSPTETVTFFVSFLYYTLFFFLPYFVRT